MNDKVRLIRQGLALWLSTTMLVMAVTVPLLERADLVHEPVAESEHDPAHCPSAHDHTVCTQVVGNLAAPAAPVERHQPHGILRVAAPVEAPASAHSVLAEGYPTRAPPLV